MFAVRFWAIRGNILCIYRDHLTIDYTLRHRGGTRLRIDFADVTTLLFLGGMIVMHRRDGTDFTCKPSRLHAEDAFELLSDSVLEVNPHCDIDDDIV